MFTPLEITETKNNYKESKSLTGFNFLDKQKGYIALIITVFVLVLILGIALNASFLVVSENKIFSNISRATQSYYGAESGVEDALLRLKSSPTMAGLSYNLDVGGGTVNVVIPNMIGGSRTVTSQGDIAGRIKKVQAVYRMDADQISFYYGAQVGDGGMVMGNNSRIKGNVFSNGSVTGSGIIDNSIAVAGNGNKIEDLSVGEDAAVHTCVDSDIGGDLTYVSGGSVSSCTAGGTVGSQPNEILPQALPISTAQIDEWKSEAQAGGVITSNITIDGASSNLGPVQIGTSSSPKNLTITNNSRVKIKGTVYVTGNVIFSNNSIIELDTPTYGSFSGVIIADGRITADNNAILRGTGQAGSYILVLSTNSSLDPATPAISVNNNAAGAIFYTSNGLILLSNNMLAREVTGYKIQINNNAVIEYESGLENPIFSSGPGGSWIVENWKEAE